MLLSNGETKQTQKLRADAEMSSSYSANQYDSAFKSQRLQNWCETKTLKQRPSARGGRTTFIANDKGHLLPGVAKNGSAWPDFKGTWDLPARIPVHQINPTARSAQGLNRLRTWGFDPQHPGKSQPSSKSSDKLQDVGKQTTDDIQLDLPGSSSTAEPASQSHPVTEGERSNSQIQDSQTAGAGCEGHSAENKQVTQAGGEDRPSSQCSAKEKPAAGEGTDTRPQTGRGQ